MPVKYDEWSRLDREGAYVHVPDTEPSRVSHLAKAYVRKHLHPDAKVVTVATPVGTFVAVAFVPRAEAPPPQPTVVEPRPQTQRQVSSETRRQRREAEELERKERQRQAFKSTLKSISSETQGYDDYVRPSGGPTVDDTIERELSAMRHEGAPQQEVEERRKELEVQYASLRQAETVGNDDHDKIWD